MSTGEVHHSYIDYIENGQPKAQTIPQTRSRVRSQVTKIIIIVLPGLSLLALSHFSQTAHANTNSQTVASVINAIPLIEKDDTKLVSLLGALVTQLKNQEARIVRLETCHTEVTEKDNAHDAATRVINAKAMIRSGPSKTSTPLMAISEGTRLVQIGSSGKWLQVYAPSGEIGWVMEELTE